VLGQLRPSPGDVTPAHSAYDLSQPLEAWGIIHCTEVPQKLGLPPWPLMIRCGENPWPRT